VGFGVTSHDEGEAKVTEKRQRERDQERLERKLMTDPIKKDRKKAGR
jgi:hypothetical protein